MQKFLDFSIKGKLILVTVLTSGLALVVACGAFLLNERISSRNDIEAEVSSLSQVIAANSTAALAFRDRAGAQEILVALRSQPHIVAASIYSKGGGVFARYLRNAASIDGLPLAPRSPGAYFGNDSILLFQEIVLDRERIGTLCIWSDLRKTSLRMKRYTSIAGLVLIGSFLVAVFLATRFQGIISGPVLKLAVTARQVSTQKDYSLRAVKLGNDEVGVLVEAFNEMLAQINEALEKLKSTTVSKDYMSGIIRSMAESLVVTDAKGSIEMVNQATLSMLGYSEEELVGRPASLMLAGDIGQKNLSSESAESVYRRKDRTCIPVRFSASSLQDGGGAQVWIAQDITERKVAEKYLLAAKEEAERANNAKSEFLSRTSHELRTPLNAILGFGQLLEMGHLDLDDRDSVNQIMKAGRHLLRIINEVLDIAGIETGRQTLSLEPVNIEDALGEACDLARPLGVRHNIHIQVKIGSGSGQYILADRQRLLQVLLNLLSNATKYNREGGGVIVTCESRPAGMIRIRISDTGPGIAPEALAKLFVPFQRLSAAEAGIEGTGLGLSVSKTFVEAMRGSIGVETVVGAGATFWIDLQETEPPAVEHASDSRLGANCIPEYASAGTVLYIEDNLTNLELVTRMLARFANIELLTATRGEAGLRLARERRPDLILLDLHLPDLSGASVLRALLADVQTQQIPVVMLTADASPDQAEALLAAGARRYLTKPVEFAELVAAISELLPSVEPIPV